MQFFVLAALLLDGVIGWNSEAHKIVARIAAEQMSNKAARFVKEHLPARGSSRVPHAEAALVQHASWADQVAGTAGYEWSSALHFVDTPYRACAAYDETRDCGRGTGRCIVTAIGNYTERASNLSLSNAERGEALKFLVHFVADAHSGLHVGFEKDIGGNTIYLASPDMSLHELWDTHLLNTYVENQGAGNWVRLSSKRISQLRKSPKLLASMKIPQSVMESANPDSVSAFIASETATTVTCSLAYKDGGKWISERGHDVSRGYLESRGDKVVEQLVRAGVRLAQVLEKVAGAYYVAENRAVQSVISKTSANRFEKLEVEFDADEFVFDPLATSEPVDDAELEALEIVSAIDGPELKALEIVGDAPAASTAVAVETSTTAAPSSTSSPKKKKKKKASEASAQAPARNVVDGVDVLSLALAKVAGRFFITSKRNIEAGQVDFELHTSGSVSVQFASSDFPTTFWLDGSVFPEGAITIDLLQAVFIHLKGNSGLQAATAVKLVTPLDEVAMSFVPQDWKEGTAAFASIAAFVRPRDDPQTIAAKYKGRTPTNEERIRGIIMGHSADLVVLMNGGIVLLTTMPFMVSDRNTRIRWVFNVMRVGKWRLVVDARLIDELIPESVAADVVRITAKPLMRELKARVRAGWSSLAPVIDEIENYVIEGSGASKDMCLSISCARMTRIEREGFYSLDMVLKPAAERLASFQEMMSQFMFA